MAKGARSRKSTMPFMKAYDFLLNRKDLTSAEKLVLIVICRFWPNPCWASNAKIAQSLGFTVRYIEKVVRCLESKGVIKRGYAHTTRKSGPHTIRVIVPKCFSDKPRLDINWVKPEQTVGQQPEHKDGQGPNNGPALSPSRKRRAMTGFERMKKWFAKPPGRAATLSPEALNRRRRRMV